jgi:hypothetical protein
MAREEKQELFVVCRAGCGSHIGFLDGDEHPDVCADCVNAQAKLHGLEVVEKTKPTKAEANPTKAEAKD